jgi:NAD(P)H-dependent nitrite reductase small subunit
VVTEKLKVAALSDVPEGGGIQVDAKGRPIALFKVQGQVYAIDNTCLHRGGPLAEGFVQGTAVSCPWHGWRFDVTNGVCLMNPSAKVPCFPVSVEGNDVFVDV